MLIKEYELEVFSLPCDPGSESYAAKVHFSADIADSLPYLNAVLKGAIYQPEAPALTWKKGKVSIFFHPHEIAVSSVDDRASAENEARELVNLVNDTWDRNLEIEPDHTARKRPAPMALFKLLPQTNCRECSEPTCFSFALKLAAGQRQVSDCPPLGEAQHAEALAKLISLATN
jgi:ArsR family metal-binding transcriptional regulator